MAVIVIAVTLLPIVLAYYLTRPAEEESMNTKLLINGKLVAGEGSKEDVLDPATGAKSPRWARRRKGRSTPRSRGRRRPSPAWSATVPKDRAALLLKVADRIEAEAAEFAETGIAEPRQAVQRGSER